MMADNFLSPKGLFKNFINFKKDASSAAIKREHNSNL